MHYKVYLQKEEEKSKVREKKRTYQKQTLLTGMQSVIGLNSLDSILEGNSSDKVEKMKFLGKNLYGFSLNPLYPPPAIVPNVYYDKYNFEVKNNERPAPFFSIVDNKDLSV